MLQHCKLLLEKIYTCQLEIHKATLLKLKKKKKKKERRTKEIIWSHILKFRKHKPAKE